MAYNTGQIAVTGTAGVLIAANPNRKRLTILNEGGDIVYIGNDGSITAANAFPIDVGDTFFDEDTTSAWQVVATSGNTATVYISEEDW